MKDEKKSTLSLPCALTQEEFDTKSHDLATVCQEITQKKVVAQGAARQAKEEIEVLEEYRHRLARVVKDRAEDRSVECVDRYDHSERMVRTVRLDSGETVKTRAMELHEYQEEMDLGLSVTTYKKEAKG